MTRPDAARGFVLRLREDGTFLLSEAAHSGLGDVAALGEVARGSWAPAARGLSLTCGAWEATFVPGEARMASPRAADTLATLEWTSGTPTSPVARATFVSLPGFNELFHPRDGWGRTQSSW